MASDGADTDAQLSGNASWNNNGWSGEIGADGPDMESGDQQEQYPTTQAGPTSDDSDDADENDEDSAEYDPESVDITTEYNPESIITTPAPPVVEERSTSTASSRPTKKPKTAGGFIVGSSDDEDEDDAPTVAPNNLKPSPNNAQSRAFTRSPLQQTTSAQDTPTLQRSEASNEAGTATTAQVGGGANMKSRLPADVVGKLEDRIKDDPKGDIEAWFALIEEQKRRHKVEDTRNTYERFLEIFPQAVSLRDKLFLTVGTLTSSRLRSG
jgi:cleavage stimulation factor subunit 3